MGGERIYVHYRIFPEDNLWVGECIELGVCTSADTRDKAERGIEEATQLYVETLVEQGELLRVLHDRGITVTAEGEMPREQLTLRSVAIPAGST